VQRFTDEIWPLLFAILNDLRASGQHRYALSEQAYLLSNAHKVQLQILQFLQTLITHVPSAVLLSRVLPSVAECVTMYLSETESSLLQDSALKVCRALYTLNPDLLYSVLLTLDPTLDLAISCWSHPSPDATTTTTATAAVTATATAAGGGVNFAGIILPLQTGTASSATARLTIASFANAQASFGHDQRRPFPWTTTTAHTCNTETNEFSHNVYLLLSEMDH
jgi:hypothetical protein